eukprot:6622033-Prymnesium_polylepis.2
MPRTARYALSGESGPTGACRDEPAGQQLVDMVRRGRPGQKHALSRTYVNEPFMHNNKLATFQSDPIPRTRAVAAL